MQKVSTPTVLCAALLVAVPARAPQAPASQPEAGTWQLVWGDEFSTAGLPDSSKWRFDVGGDGWGNQELEYYTDRRLENARVADGHLIIEARRDGWQGHTYTSARMASAAGWTYGRIQVSAKLPSGRGTWPAIWMLPDSKVYGTEYWPDNGEIDIMEHVGFDPDVIHGSIHTKAYNHVIRTERTATIDLPSARTGFNVYAAEWTPEAITIYVNDRKYFTFANERRGDPSAEYTKWPFDKPFHVMLNLAVGGTWGGTKGVDESIWPQRMEIDYVRVFQRLPETVRTRR